MPGVAGMRMFAVLPLALSVVWSPGCSESPPADPKAGMRELYELSDLPRQIQPISAFIESALDLRREQFTAEQLEVAKEVVRAQFGPENLAEQARDRVERQQRREFVDATLAWLRSPAVGKVMGAKVTLLRPPSSPEDMMAFFENEQVQSTTQKRRDLIERYDRAARASEIAAETMLLSSNCAAVLADALKPPEERIGAAALRDSASARRELLEPFFQEMTVVVSLFAFKDISDDEIESFVAFAESEAGRWYFETTSAALFGALRDITANLDTVFIAALPARPPS